LFEGSQLTPADHFSFENRYWQQQDRTFTQYITNDIDFLYTDCHTIFMDEQQSFQLSPVPDENHHKRVLLYAIGTILFLLIGGGIGYMLGINNTANVKTLYSNNQATTNASNVAIISPGNNQTTINSAVKPLATPTLPPQSLVDTMNWKTYTSTKAKYSFQYPPDWPLVNVPVSPQYAVCVEDLDFTPNYNSQSEDTNIAVILVSKESNINTIDDYVSTYVKGDSSKINLKYTTIGGEKAISYTLSGGIPPLPIIEYVVVKNGFYYEIRIEDSIETNKNREKNINDFNHLISTVTFTQ